jgi:DNA-binding NtrC family response regulator
MMKILVADDEQTTRDLFAQVLQLRGDEYVGVDNGQAAVEHAATEAYDVVFLDILMPTMDGVEALRTILQHRPDTMVVLMTGFAVEEKIRDAMQLGAFDFFYKPFSIMDLVSILEKAKKSRQLKTVDEGDNIP